MDERLDDDIARRHRKELTPRHEFDPYGYCPRCKCIGPCGPECSCPCCRSHASEFKCSGEHDPVSGACLKGEER